jgi:chemotaxis protein MotB
MERQILRWACGAALVASLAMAGCKSSSEKTQTQQDAKDRQLLELTEEKHRLEQEKAQLQAQNSALAASQPRYERAPEKPDTSSKTAPAAPRGPSKSAPPSDVPASLKEKGVQPVTVGGHAALRVPGSIFGAGSATVTAAAQPTLKQVAEYIRKHHASGKIRVEGNTDSDPIVKSKNHFKSNQALSDARAKAVRDALAAAGIEKSRIETAGQGDAKPIASNKTTEGKRQNRRVEILFLAD